MGLHLPANRLSAAAIRSQIETARKQGKGQRLTDGGGLYLDTTPGGRGHWRLQYRYGQRLRTMPIGAFPTVSLKDARQAREVARSQLEAGIDPHPRKIAQDASEAVTMRQIADDWLENRKTAKNRAESTLVGMRRRLGFMPDALLDRPIVEITTDDLERVVLALKSADNARRLRTDLISMCNLAAIRPNPATDIRLDLIPETVTEHWPAATVPADIGLLLADIDDYTRRAKQPATAAALQIMPLIFARPSEVVSARWVDVDLDAMAWTFPAKRLKGSARRKATAPDLIFPITEPVAVTLTSLREITGRSELVFARLGGQGKTQHITVSGLGNAIARLGGGRWHKKHCAHGFRAMASTTLYDANRFDRDAIELQLSHMKGDAVRAAYDRAAMLDERRRMLAWLSDEYLRLKSQATATIAPGPH